MIPYAEAFAMSIENGIEAAAAGALVTFGIVPDCPHTGYGYIETEAGGGETLNVQRFVEKPSLAAAEQFLDSGKFYWNGGTIPVQDEHHARPPRDARSGHSRRVSKSLSPRSARISAFAS